MSMSILDPTKRQRRKAKRNIKKGKFKNIPTKRNKSCKQKGSCKAASKARQKFLKF